MANTPGVRRRADGTLILLGRARSSEEALVSLMMDPQYCASDAAQDAIRELQELDDLGGIESEESLVLLSSKIRGIVALLEIEDPEFLADPRLLTVITGRLSFTLHMLWITYWMDKPKKATTTDLFHWMRDFICSLYRCTDYSQLVRGGESPLSPCPLCAEEHPLEDCEEFLHKAMNKRWNTVRRNGLCFVCFSKTHVVGACFMPSCDQPGCGMRHHRLLCREFSQEALTKRWKIVRRNGLCFVCFSTKHLVRDCHEASCDYPGCGLRHHRLLHGRRGSTTAGSASLRADAFPDPDPDQLSETIDPPPTCQVAALSTADPAAALESSTEALAVPDILPLTSKETLSALKILDILSSIEDELKICSSDIEKAIIIWEATHPNKKSARQPDARGIEILLLADQLMDIDE